MTIKPGLENVHLVGRCVESVSALRLSVEDSATMQLCVVEAVTNIVKYGSCNVDHDVIAIHVRFDSGARRVVIEIEDSGEPVPAEVFLREFEFDPLALDNLPEGGMGVHIIREFADELRYVTSGDGRNCLTIGKRSSG